MPRYEILKYVEREQSSHTYLHNRSDELQSYDPPLTFETDKIASLVASMSNPRERQVFNLETLCLEPANEIYRILEELKIFHKNDKDNVYRERNRCTGYFIRRLDYTMEQAFKIIEYDMRRTLEKKYEEKKTAEIEKNKKIEDDMKNKKNEEEKEKKMYEELKKKYGA